MSFIYTDNKQSHSIISTNGQTMQKSDRHFMTKAIIRFFY